VPGGARGQDCPAGESAAQQGHRPGDVAAGPGDEGGAVAGGGLGDGGQVITPGCQQPVQGLRASGRGRLDGELELGRGAEGKLQRSGWFLPVLAGPGGGRLAAGAGHGQLRAAPGRGRGRG
jgi:hypothetical protein